MFRSPRRPGARICGARLSGGRGYCRAIAITGKLRCRWHGGRSTGPKTPFGKAVVVAATTAGRARWVERMRKAKAMGLIERFPGGRQPKARAQARAMKREPKVIERARAVVASKRTELPAVAVNPWNGQTHAEKLDTLTGMALDKTREILELRCDTENLKLLAIQKDAALSILSTQTKVDDNRLRARQTDMMPELLRRLAKIEKADS